MKEKQQRGFTLIELLVALTLLAILLGIGAPSFLEFSRNNRLTGAANDLLADINFARTEAVKRHSPVTVCATSDPFATTPTCVATSTTTFSNWIVFVDDANPAVAATSDANAVVNTGEVVLRRHENLRTGTTARSDSGFVTYGMNGFPMTVGSPAVASATRVVLCDGRGNTATSGGNSAGRAVTVSPTGRAGVTRSISDITNLGGC